MTTPADDFSHSFYPFLNAADRAPLELLEGLRHSLLVKAEESAAVKNRFFTEQQDEIIKVAIKLAQAFHLGHRLFVCGNGGSATDAQHIAVEFMHPITVGRKALPVVCLNNDLATVTAVANDVGYADVFARQLIALGSEGDVLLALSTSGNSENLARACETARRLKLITVGLAGGNGGRLAAMHAAGMLDHCLTVPVASIHRVQETHVTLYHIIWDLVHELLPHRPLLENEATGN